MTKRDHRSYADVVKGLNSNPQVARVQRQIQAEKRDPDYGEANRVSKQQTMQLEEREPGHGEANRVSKQQDHLKPEAPQAHKNPLARVRNMMEREQTLDKIDGSALSGTRTNNSLNQQTMWGKSTSPLGKQEESATPGAGSENHEQPESPVLSVYGGR